MDKILFPVLISFAVAIICGLILTIASRLFAVKEDEKFVKIRDCLPGANCGACGYSGCDGYAKALSDGKTDMTNACVPGGDAAAKEIAAVLGVKAEEVVKKVAYIACNGNCDAAPRKYEYHGQISCRTANMSYNGDKHCTFACLGYGDCANICPQKAISIKNGVANIDYDLCVGCGMCTRVCPNHIIHLVNASSKIMVLCSNHDKGAITRKACSNGCIGCGKCQKTCPNDAIHVDHNLAVIDYDKCIGCGDCAKACPIHCIYEQD